MQNSKIWEVKVWGKGQGKGRNWTVGFYIDVSNK